MDIADRRKALGLRQDRVAELLGVRKAQLNHWEKGRQSLPDARRVQLDRIYGEFEEAERRATTPG